MTGVWILDTLPLLVVPLPVPPAIVLVVPLTLVELAPRVEEAKEKAEDRAEENVLGVNGTAPGDGGNGTLCGEKKCWCVGVFGGIGPGVLMATRMMTGRKARWRRR